MTSAASWLATEHALHGERLSNSSARYCNGSNPALGELLFAAASCPPGWRPGSDSADCTGSRAASDVTKSGKADELDCAEWATVWQAGTGGGWPNLVVISSMSMDRKALASIKGINHFEERGFVWLQYLDQPGVRIAVPTSEPVPEGIINYHLSLLPNICVEEARRRLLVPCCNDSGDQPLSEKLLARPEVLAGMRAFVGDGASLLAYQETEAEAALSRTLAIGVDHGCSPRLAWLGAKAGGRQVLGEARVPHAAGGYELVYDAEALADAMLLTWRHCMGARRRAALPARVYVKMNEGMSGMGNALLTLPPQLHAAVADGRLAVARAALVDALYSTALQPADSSKSAAAFMDLALADGCIWEEEAGGGHCDGATSPSVQMHIHADGRLHVVATHEQLLEGNGLYTGAAFPARPDYRMKLHEHGMAVGRVLARHGCRGRFAVDFLAWPEGDAWRLVAIEINLRWGGTTHPMHFMELATRGRLNSRGEFELPRPSARTSRASVLAPGTAPRSEPPDGTALGAACAECLQGGCAGGSGRVRCYLSCNVQEAGLVGTAQEEVAAHVRRHPALRYDTACHVGVVVHVFGWLPRYGKLQLSAYGSCCHDAARRMADARRALQEFAARGRDALDENAGGN